MIRGNDLEERAYEPQHIEVVLSEIESNFPKYFSSFSQLPLEQVFQQQIDEHKREQDAYRSYLDVRALREFEYDPAAFKPHTRKNCPIIRRCLNAKDERMKDYQKSFNMKSGRDLLEAVKHIARFGLDYMANFDDAAHEGAATYQELGLEVLNEHEYGCYGVIGYGVQSSMLHGSQPHCFAHRSQNAVWSLYFLSSRKDFGLEDGSEFLMIHDKQGTCEQNYFYPPELFGFYALRLYQMLKNACQDLGIDFVDRHRYIYLSTFCDHVADVHRSDISVFKWSSDYVETHWF